jgi:hypothetical protein
MLVPKILFGYSEIPWACNWETAQLAKYGKKIFCLQVKYFKPSCNFMYRFQQPARPHSEYTGFLQFLE